LNKRNLVIALSALLVIVFAISTYLTISLKKNPTKEKTTNNKQNMRDVPDELKKFKELLDLGAITQEEFDAKKKELLGL